VFQKKSHFKANSKHHSCSAIRKRHFEQQNQQHFENVKRKKRKEKTIVDFMSAHCIGNTEVSTIKK